MRRCTLSTVSLACLPHSRRRFKPFNDKLRAKNRTNSVNYVPKGSKARRNTKHEPLPLSTPQRQRAHDDSISASTCSGSDDCEIAPPTWQPGKGWNVRRRQSRVNGADIYVARMTKSGTGSAKPCWRCLEWCRWAGVKRVFHWNSEEGKFDVVKVNGDGRENYETRADGRLFAGKVSFFFSLLAQKAYDLHAVQVLR